MILLCCISSTGCVPVNNSFCSFITLLAGPKENSFIYKCSLSLILASTAMFRNICFPVGVYTKNRNFRMYKSSKAGKNVILKIAEDNKFIPNCEKDVSLEEAYFLSSLICNIR